MHVMAMPGGLNINPPCMQCHAGPLSSLPIAAPRLVYQSDCALVHTRFAYILKLFYGLAA
jgi:hypothetical protein